MGNVASITDDVLRMSPSPIQKLAAVTVGSAASLPIIVENMPAEIPASSTPWYPVNLKNLDGMGVWMGRETDMVYYHYKTKDKKLIVDIIICGRGTCWRSTYTANDYKFITTTNGKVILPILPSNVVGKMLNSVDYKLVNLISLGMEKIDEGKKMTLYKERGALMIERAGWCRYAEKCIPFVLLDALDLLDSQDSAGNGNPQSMTTSYVSTVPVEPVETTTSLRYDDWGAPTKIN